MPPFARGARVPLFSGIVPSSGAPLEVGRNTSHPNHPNHYSWIGVNRSLFFRRDGRYRRPKAVGRDAALGKDERKAADRLLELPSYHDLVTARGSKDGSRDLLTPGGDGDVGAGHQDQRCNARERVSGDSSSIAGLSPY